MEQTSNGIEFEWWLTGPQGARYCLYPVKGKHSENDVKKARNWLYYNQDVVSIQVRWRNDEQVLPPEKIPDLVIIKELREEIGKLQSYIQELEDKWKKDSQKDKDKQRSEIMKEELYKKVKSENSKLKKEIIKLRENISELVVRLNSLEKKIPQGSLLINT